MGRFIAFDRATASELSRHTKRAPQLGHGDPLKAALAGETPALVLLESGEQGQVLRVELRRPERVAVAPQPVIAAPMVKPRQGEQALAPLDKADTEPEAYGFLGLSDAPLLSEETDASHPPQPKKKAWWKR